MEKGKVKFYNDSKGFGFIVADTGEEVFFHKSNVKDSGFRNVLRQGDAVQFDLKVEQRGKRALNVVRV
ncbi:MAG: cold shock domain-containing protein [Ignavibacteriales bacterium]|nr:cold shock domain-containing protein [Ignavibacteriales bacterium]